MTTTPKIIINLEFTQPKCPKEAKDNFEAKAEWLNNRAFFTCNAAYSILDYMGDETKSVIDGVREISILGYMEKGKDKSAINDPQRTAYFNTEKVYSKREVQELRDRMRKNDGNIWHGFISMREDQAVNFSTQKQCIEFLKRTFKTFIDETHLKWDNIEVVASLHVDRVHHHHIHYTFFEKEPLQRKNGKREWTNKGEIKSEALAGWLVRSNEFLEESKYYVFRDEIIKELDFSDGKNNYGWNELKAKQKLRELTLKLPKHGHTYYDDTNMKEFKPLVDETVKFLMNINPEAAKAYKEIQAELTEKQKRGEEIVRNSNYVQNEEKIQKFVEGLYADLRNDLKKRLGNKVIAMAKDLHNQHVANVSSRQYSRKIEAKNFSKQINQSIKAFVKSMPTTLYEIRRDFTETLREAEWRQYQEKLNEMENS